MLLTLWPKNRSRHARSAFLNCKSRYFGSFVTNRMEQFAHNAVIGYFMEYSGRGGCMQDILVIVAGIYANEQTTCCNQCAIRKHGQPIKSLNFQLTHYSINTQCQCLAKILGRLEYDLD